jgi:hypothetical protein
MRWGRDERREVWKRREGVKLVGGRGGFERLGIGVGREKGSGGVSSREKSMRLMGSGRLRGEGGGESLGGRGVPAGWERGHVES